MAAVFPHIIPDIESWPIYKLSQRREAFIQSIIQGVTDEFSSKSASEIEDILSKTIYLEIKRCKENPWKVDPGNEIKYWRGLRKDLEENLRSENSAELNIVLLQRITNRYSEEIVGNFKIRTFRLARKFLTSIFRRLLNSASGKNHRRLWGSQYQLYERLLVKGPIEKVRKLSQKGTVVIVPTHFSNLDSILIGYAIDGIMGLPAFHYGAGLNLYDLELAAYFINRLGAYKVDRRKKNPLYLSTLKTMSLNSIKDGVNTLFFPGGTRSRSGALEDSLKMGLLGTVIEAQRKRLEDGEKEKIFVVPLILSYHFVLESKFMIEQHLKSTGQEQYLGSKDAAKSYKNYLKFLWDLFAHGSEIYLTLGEPIDVVGNHVDDDGDSYDRKDRPVEIEEYFKLNGELDRNPQREYVYTKILAEKIVESFHKDNTVLSSHVVAFTLFRMIIEKFPDESIFSVLAQDASKLTFDYSVFRDRIETTQIALQEMAEKSMLKITDVLRGDSDNLIKTGIDNMGVYHSNKPVIINDKNRIETEDLKLLYYYHNRLDHYELEKRVEKILEKKKEEIA